MDLDFKSVKALASPTRIEILNMVLDEEATTTKLSNELDKSKSTVSSHLKVLTESGLLEKDQEDGRRRVIYRPTTKAKAIIRGKERKVKFSVVSSALTTLAAVFVLNRSVADKISGAKEYSSRALEQESADAMGAMDSGGADIMMQTAEKTNQTANISADAATQAAQNFQMEHTLIVLGVGLIVTSVLALGYGFILSRLRE